MVKESTASRLVFTDEEKTLLVYYCPACRHYHAVTVRGQNECGAGPWKWNGDEERPALSPSVKHRRVDEEGEYVCHHFVERGRIRYLNDCTHEFAGRTIMMESV